MISEKILDVAENVQEFINDSYNHFAKNFCNLDTHRFQIKQEVIAKSGLFVTKKRYGMRIINDNGVKVNKILVKGLDTVRSNFPPALRKLLSDVLEDILADVPKDKIDDRIINFKKSMKLMNIDKIATPTGVKGLGKYARKGEEIEIPGTVIKSPIVGTAYLATEPGGKKFIEIGKKIKKGDTIMIVEAMKTMNHVPSSSDGIVKEISVEDGQPVEFGQKLIILE